MSDQASHSLVKSDMTVLQKLLLARLSTIRDDRPLKTADYNLSVGSTMTLVVRLVNLCSPHPRPYMNGFCSSYFLTLSFPLLLAL